MNIIFIVNQHYPFGMAGTMRIKLFAEYLAGKNNDIKILISNQDNGDNAKSGINNGVKYSTLYKVKKPVLVYLLVYPFIVFYKFKFLSRLFLIFSFIFPIIVFQNSTFSEKTFFEEASNMFSDSKIKNLSMDTRSFLYKETFSDLNYNKKLFFGKGPLGSYYSPMFDNLGSQGFYSGEDHYIRSTVEVGLLQYLLKGGVLYFVIISFIFLLTSFQSSKNDFINYLLLTIACYYLLFTIENLPFYDYLNALIWIIIGISISPNNKNLLNEDINKILTNNN